MRKSQTADDQSEFSRHIWRWRHICERISSCRATMSTHLLWYVRKSIKNQLNFSKSSEHIELRSLVKISQHHYLVSSLMQSFYKEFLRIKLKSKMSHSIRMNRDQSTKIKTEITSSIEKKMKNAYAKKNISSKNAHTSSNSIEKESERRTKILEMTCEIKLRKNWWFIELSNTSLTSIFWMN